MPLPFCFYVAARAHQQVVRVVKESVARSQRAPFDIQPAPGTPQTPLSELEKDLVPPTPEEPRFPNGGRK